MTDNRTTELLCKLLEERGIEWKDGDASYEIEWSTPDGRHCSAMYWKPTFTVLVSGCTPEQAIAATLLSEFGSGTLTAEQVREAIACNSWQETSMLFEFNDSSWQAIADELNARAERTCELIDNGTWGYPYGCSECGASFDADVNNGDFNYCPNCGARVVE